LSFAFYRGGVTPLVPLLLNVTFAVLVLIAANAILSWY
jgi:hypothetical protein